MNRQPNRTRVKPRMIVDLKAHKRLRPSDDCVVKAVDQPQEKIPALRKINPNYREGTHEDILELLKAENILEDEGVFLKGKIPPQYEINMEKILANGGFSKCVRLYEDPVNPSMSYVCKEVRAKNFNKDEVKHMCQLNDVYICQIYGLVHKNDEYHIFMEYCGTNLHELTKSTQFFFDQIIDITKQLCMAVEFAHNKKIIHLDIKPENICLLFTSDGIALKLTDWGSSKPASLSTEIQSVTFSYSSPELLYLYVCQILYSDKLNKEMLSKAVQLTQKFCGNYNNIETVTTKSDSFSIGLTIIYVKSKKHLYEKQKKFQSLYDLLEMFAENPDAAKNLLPVPGDFITCIVKKLIEGDSHNRSSVKEVQKMINDYQQNSDYNFEVNQDASQSDKMPVPENRQYNIPNFDMLF